MKLSHVRSYLQLLDQHVLGLRHQKRMEIHVCACLCMCESTSTGIRQIKILPILIFSTFKTIRQIFGPPNFPAIRYVVILPVPI